MAPTTVSELVFRPNYTGYWPENACIMAYLASWAYDDPTAITNNVQTVLGCSECHTITEVLGTHAFVAIHKNAAFVFFRGTEQELVNWKTDLNIPFDNAKPSVVGIEGKTHKGFRRALDAVWSPASGVGLWNTIKEYCGDRPLWFAGHSLGGALAVLAASRASLDPGLNIAGVYTFGQPRTGNASFASWYDDRLGNKTFRFINAADLVTQIPSRIALGYSHVGRILYFSDAGEMTDGVGFLTYIKDHMETLLLTAGLSLIGIADHNINNYVSRLMANRDKTFSASQLKFVP